MIVVDVVPTAKRATIVSLHAAAAKAAAAAKNVPYIDLTSLSTAWYNTLGSEAAALKFHANGSDPTHTNLAGADKLASLVAANIKAQNLGRNGEAATPGYEPTPVDRARCADLLCRPGPFRPPGFAPPLMRERHLNAPSIGCGHEPMITADQGGGVLT